MRRLNVVLLKWLHFLEEIDATAFELHVLFRLSMLVSFSASVFNAWIPLFDYKLVGSLDYDFRQVQKLRRFVVRRFQSDRVFIVSSLLGLF